MLWSLIALINPIFHAAANHIDKHLVSRYFKGGEVGALVLFSSLFAAFSLPIVWWFHPAVLDLAWSKMLLLMLNGALIIVAYIFYLKALNKEEASYVVPFFQLVPIMGFFLGYFLLGEMIVRSNLIGALIVIVGGIILSFEIKEKGLHFKKEIVLMMLGASLCYALNAVLFKLIAVQSGFWLSLFWDFAGKVVFGVIVFLFVRSYRQQFLQVIHQNSWSILGLAGLNELLVLIGEGALALSTLLVPILLVQTVGALQPFFVFLFGVLLTIFWPQFGKESLERKYLLQKIVGIILIVVGGFLIV